MKGMDTWLTIAAAALLVAAAIALPGNATAGGLLIEPVDAFLAGVRDQVASLFRSLADRLAECRCPPCNWDVSPLEL